MSDHEISLCKVSDVSKRDPPARIMLPGFGHLLANVKWLGENTQASILGYMDVFGLRIQSWE